MTRHLSPRRRRSTSLLTTFGLLPVVLATVVSTAALRAQDAAPGTLDSSFDIARSRSSSFLPAQLNLTPFALALQPGQDPVVAALPYRREVPAARTKLLVGGDGAALFRTFLTRTLVISTLYGNVTDASGNIIATGVPFSSYTAFDAGDIDPTFLAGPGVSNAFGNSGRIVYSLAVNPDGSVLVGGLFGKTSVSGSVFKDRAKDLVLLNFNGDTEITNTLDANGAVTSQSQGPFNSAVGNGANNSVLAILRRSTDSGTAPFSGSNGSILLGGQFTRFNADNLGRGRVVQLLPTGAVDTAFDANLGSGADGIVYSLAEAVDPNTGAANGQVYVCGDYGTFNGKGPGKLVRLNPDGTRDTSFAPKIVGRAIAVAVQPNGQILLGGDLDSVNGSAVTNIARLNYDGSLDAVFLANATVSQSSPNNIPPTSVYVLRVQADGRILVGGNYLQVDDTARRYLGRLNADGTLDTSFDAGGDLLDPNQTNPTRIVSNAIQSVVEVPRDPSLEPATDLIYSQTRADRKQVAGDNGFYPNPVRRLVGDPLVTPTSSVNGTPVVRIGADGPTVTVGDLSINSAAAVGDAVPNPGTPGLFRITRTGATTDPLDVLVKIVGAAEQQNLNVTYDLRLVTFASTSTGTDAAIVTVLTPTVQDPALSATSSPPVVNGKFTVTIPAGESSATILVEGFGPANGRTQGANEPVTLKLKSLPTYTLAASQRAATVTILPFSF